MRDAGTHEAVCRPDAARHGLELTAGRVREARPSRDRLACGGPARRERVQGCFRAGGLRERMADHAEGVRP
jgi:hypothetical protein